VKWEALGKNRDAAGADYARQFTLPGVSMARRWRRRREKSNDFGEAQPVIEFLEGRKGGGIAMRLRYVIKFVSDMDQAVAFHRDALCLPLKFASPDWSEFATGETTLALHGATDEHPVGTVELGFDSDDIDAFYAERDARGVTFSEAPKDLHGMRVGKILDPDGAEMSVGGR
jgi:catechol 2,3-dioxygenase-like lactoylglutathione lyase family enzyme